MAANGNGLLWLLVVIAVVSLKANASFVGMTLVENAVAKGAVCLDGSPPAYHLDRASGAGINNWIVHIEGGGWCNNITTCLARKSTRLGSSDHMFKEIAFSGILGNKQSLNPDFYNWNRVKVRYCDGASFTGDVEKVDPALNLHFRGARIFRAVIEDLLAKGMSKAENAILSGCSAGGLTTILHCDSFRALLPMGAKVKCIADAGYFINTLDVSGAAHIENYYDEVVTLQGSANNLPSYCTSRTKPNLCFFPQNVIQQIRTPIFLLNAAYDSWQIKNILAPGVADPHGNWHFCKLDIKKCSSSQIETMQGLQVRPSPEYINDQNGLCIPPGFRQDFLRALQGVDRDPARGMFINSCYAHCQSEMQETWLRSDSPLLDKTPIAKAVADWFYDRRPFVQIDCPYPCDSTCHNRVFEPSEVSSS